MQKQWTTGVSGNPKNFGVKIISYEKTQAHLDAIIAFGRWKAEQRTDRVQEQAIETEATFMAELFPSDHKHCYDTRHDELGIVRVRAPRTRGR